MSTARSILIRHNRRADCKEGAMSRAMTAGLVLLVGMTGIACNASAADAGKLRLVSDQTITGFTFPESVGCDPSGKALYVSEFGGSALKPAEKDGNGRITKLSLDGKP